MTIFKAYDIRGLYPEELDEDTAYNIARAFVTLLKCKKVVVSRDMRESGIPISKALIKGLTDQGADVIDIGLSSTPMNYFANNFLKADASIMITASHNPKEYNGFKLNREKSIPISEETGIKEIEKLVLKNKFKDVEKGNVTSKDILKDYVNHVANSVHEKSKAFLCPENRRFSWKNINKNLKIIIDAGNGMAGLAVEKIFNKLGLSIEKMYFELDGNFPNHEANPLKDKNVKEIKDRVKKEKFDLGIAFDGDVDRVFFIDENGNKIPSDHIIALFAQELLKENPNQIIINDLRTSKIIKETVEANNGTSIMSRVGHVFFKQLMREKDGLFAGELSGHYYFRDNFYTDSGVIAAVKLIEIMSKHSKPLSELIKPFKKYYQSGELNSEVKDKQKKIKEIEKHYKNAEIKHIDGLSIYFKDWWFNIRPSNTEDLLRLNLEADSKELLEIKKKELLELIKN